MNRNKRICECVGAGLSLIQSIAWMATCIAGFTLIKLNGIMDKPTVAIAEYKTVWITMAVCAVAAFLSGSYQLYPARHRDCAKARNKRFADIVSALAALAVGLVCAVESTRIARIDDAYRHTYTVMAVIALLSVAPSLAAAFMSHDESDSSIDNQ